jgi:hypothetical protein
MTINSEAELVPITEPVIDWNIVNEETAKNITINANVKAKTLLIAIKRKIVLGFYIFWGLYIITRSIMPWSCLAKSLLFLFNSS